MGGSTGVAFESWRSRRFFNRNFHAVSGNLSHSPRCFGNPHHFGHLSLRTMAVSWISTNTAHLREHPKKSNSRRQQTTELIQHSPNKIRYEYTFSTSSALCLTAQVLSHSCWWRWWWASLNIAAARCTSCCQLKRQMRTPNALACSAVLTVRAIQKPNTLQRW